MTSVTVDGSTLHINGKSVTLPCKIESVVETSDVVVVLLRTDDGEISGDNVWGFNTNGIQLWKAEEVTAPSDDVNTYVRIWEENGEVWAADWKGMDYKLDPTTGRHVERRFRK